MNIDEFSDFLERKKNCVPYDANKRYKEGYKQSIKDVCSIIEKSRDLSVLQYNLKLPKGKDLHSLSYHYEMGYCDFIKKIKSEVHRRKLELKWGGR